ncbi:MAG: extracellular solute-binding protein [Candidatus Bruticola sp.]
MRRFCFFSIFVLLASLLLAGCMQKGTGPKPLLIWSGMDAEFPTLKRQCQEFEKQTGLKVEFLKVPYRDLKNKFLVAAPAGLGPDIVVGAQDWIGMLTVAGLLSPIPDEVINQSDYVPVALDSVRFNQQIYMAPLCMECLAMFRNPDLMPERPKTTAELVAQAQRIQKESAGKINGFYFEIKEPYFSMPFLLAEGAYMIGKDSQGNYVPTDVGINTPGAAKGAEFLRDLSQKYDLIKQGSTENISRTLFLEGKAAVIPNGPWFLDQIRNSGVHYVIDPFPVTDSGNLIKPFLGVQGFMLNKYSQRPQDAGKLMAFLSSPENMADMSKTSGRPPTKISALELCKDNKDIIAFADICANSVPMPTHPAAMQIWEPMRQSIELISKGQVDIPTELKTANDRIVQKINLMLE